MKCAIIVFPGSNCDRDAIIAARMTFCDPPVAVWHENTELPPNTDLVILPGGFSHGDHLRPGAIAARSQIITAVHAHAQAGGYVLGICNGFQILTEMRLLPGALIRNAGLTFVCRRQPLIVQNPHTSFTCAFQTHHTTIPIAHLHGNYRACNDDLERLEAEGRIAFTYPPDDNPNGSAGNIAGILSENGRILGMMPHPERAVDPKLLGGTGGTGIFNSLQNTHGHNGTSV